MNVTKRETISDRQAHWIIALLGGVLIVLFFLSFLLGRFDVPFGEVLRILINRIMPLEQTWTDRMAIAVVNIRLPRILLACLVGCCLTSAGIAYQTVFQNPMAAPDILGASSGACFGAALAILLQAGRAGITASAFAFSMLSVFLVYLVGSRTRGNRVMSILLAGVMISSLFSAATSYVKLVADPTNQLPAITYWLMGSLNIAGYDDILVGAPVIVTGLVVLMLIRWRLNLLVLSEDELTATGVNVKALRVITILCAAAMTASVVAMCGQVGWVGLIVPHICRMKWGSNYMKLVPASISIGADFVVVVDTLARSISAAEIPISVLTAIIGAPFFIYLLLRKEELL